MSAASRYPNDIGYHGLRMTADEFFALGETQERYELIDGVVVMSPSPTPLHGEAFNSIFMQLQNYAHLTKLARVYAEIDVQLSSGRVYRPDIAAYQMVHLPKRPDRLISPPDLAVEILSASTRVFDLITKRDDYEAFGVNEYWVVEPKDGSLRAWRRSGKSLLQVAVEGDTFPCSALPGMMLDLKALREACQ